MTGSAQNKSGEPKVIATHRKALRDYHILDRMEAGIELRGAEVKSVRDGLVSLNEAFARLENGQIFLFGLHIQPYSHSRATDYDPVRPKRLLLHKSEIHRLLGQTAQQGCTMVPLKLYTKHGLIKVELALAKGKHDLDKRETLKRKTADREMARALAHRQRR